MSARTSTASRTIGHHLSIGRLPCVSLAAVVASMLRRLSRASRSRSITVSGESTTLPVNEGLQALDPVSIPVTTIRRMGWASPGVGVPPLSSLLRRSAAIEPTGSTAPPFGCRHPGDGRRWRVCPFPGGASLKGPPDHELEHTGLRGEHHRPQPQGRSPSLHPSLPLPPSLHPSHPTWRSGGSPPAPQLV